MLQSCSSHPRARLYEEQRMRRHTCTLNLIFTNKNIDYHLDSVKKQDENNLSLPSLCDNVVKPIHVKPYGPASAEHLA